MIFSQKKNKYPSSIGIFTDTLYMANLCKIIRDVDAINFVKKIIISNYKQFFKEDQSEILLIDKTFKLLADSQANGISISNLKQSIDFTFKNIYSSENMPNIFKKYNQYKSLLKPKYYYSLIKKDIIGKNILDFGTGKGHMYKFLFNNGFNSISADVIDYREIDDINIPFIKVNGTNDISSKIPSHDTSLLITVLHHISEEHVINSLKKLSKISKRLIIIEDVWDSSYISEQKKTKNIEEFLKLSETAKEDSIKLMDFYGNVVTQGLTNMNLPFQFKSIKEWKEILHKSGFSIKSIEFIGLPKVSFHGFFQVKIVCDTKKHKKESTSSK